MKVYIPPPLRTYTSSKEVDVEGSTLAAVLSELDQHYPGIRFRIIDEQDHIREHVRFFINQDMATELSAPILPTDEVRIICAVSGG